MSDALSPIPAGGITSRPLLDQPGGAKVVLFAMDGGQEITPHSAPFPAHVEVLEGRLRVQVGEDVRELGPADAVRFPADRPHGIRALEPAHFLLTMHRGRPATAHAHGEEGGACAHHCHSERLAAPGPQVRNALLRGWMAEHDEALRRLDRMEAGVQAGDWGVVGEEARWMYEELKAHNEAEERLLFPLMDPHFSGNHGPTHCMRDEHRLLWDLDVLLLGNLGEGGPRQPENAGRLALQFVGTLRSHIEKENKVLYPMAESMLTAAQLAGLEALAAG